MLKRTLRTNFIKKFFYSTESKFSSEKLFIKQGTVINPDEEFVGDVMVEDGKIKKVCPTG